MAQILFTDESGIVGPEQCYSIGALIVPENGVEELDQLVKDLTRAHGVMGEIKWNKVANSHGLINFGLDILKRILGGKYSYSAIVVNKPLYNNWKKDKNKAFYQTYTFLVKYCAERLKQGVAVQMDNKQESYPKHHEVVQIISNHMLAQVNSTGEIISTTKVESKQHLGVQVADILTGAINSAHCRFFSPAMQISLGKKVFIKRMAQSLGWDDVIYDTMPNTRFNIWHFPIEYRATPETKQIQPNLQVPFVKADELKE